jgi:hypothetical protein
VRNPQSAGRDPRRDTAPAYRGFPGKAAAINLLRVLHLAGVVGLGAMLLSGAPWQGCGAYCLLVLISGGAILALDVWSHQAYILEVKGAGMLLKLALVGAIPFAGDGRVALFWAALGLSVLVSHAPGSVRNRRLIR